MHDTNKKKVRRLMEENRKDNSVCTINFDLQKVLTTPRAEIGPLYYYSKLCVWNFTIYEINTHIGHCFVWNETIGCTGSSEIGSILLQFFKEKSSTGVKNFCLYSDSCAGQNKNQNVFNVYIKAAIDFKISITHRLVKFLSIIQLS